MFKLFINRFAAGSVLLAGLISCSKEQKTTDVYQPPGPAIETSDGRSELKAWDQLRERRLELQDALDFSASSATRILIRSHCKNGNQNVYGDFSFTGRSTIQLWEVLPEEVLALDLSNQPQDCGFELNLYNSAGSNHIFIVRPAPLREERPSPASAAPEPASGEKTPLTLNSAQLQSVRLRYANRLPAAAKISCQDMNTLPLPFEQVLQMAQFDFKAPEMRPGHERKLLLEHHVQLCRAIILQQGRRAAFSNLFKIVLEKAPLTVRTTAVAIRATQDVATIEQIMQATRRGAALVINEWSIGNPENSIRYLRLPKQAGALQGQVFIEAAGKKPNKVVLASLSYVLRAQGARAPGADQTVSIPAHGTLILQAVFVPGGEIDCRVQFDLRGIILRDFTPLTVVEVASTGELLANVQLAPGELRLIPRGILDMETLPARGGCNWP